MKIHPSLKNIYIVICDESGETVLGLNVPLNAQKCPVELRNIINEAYIIPRLIEDAGRSLEISAEITKKR